MDEMVMILNFLNHHLPPPPLTFDQRWSLWTMASNIISFAPFASGTVKSSSFPLPSSAESVLSYQPDGILLSNGPGDPEGVPYAIETDPPTHWEKTDFRHLPGTPALGIGPGRKNI